MCLHRFPSAFINIALDFIFVFRLFSYLLISLHRSLFSVCLFVCLFVCFCVYLFFVSPFFFSLSFFFFFFFFAQCFISFYRSRFICKETSEQIFSFLFIPRARLCVLGELGVGEAAIQTNYFFQPSLAQMVKSNKCSCVYSLSENRNGFVGFKLPYIDAGRCRSN